MLIPYSRSFFTRIPHPELLSSLSRISFSSGSGWCRNLLDQHLSKALHSLVPDLHYLLFSEKGILLYHHPYCFPIQSQTLFAIGAASPVKVKSVKSRIPLMFPESSAVFWANSCLVPRPHYYARPMRFGSRGPRKFLRPRQTRRSETFCVTWGGAFGGGRADERCPAAMESTEDGVKPSIFILCTFSLLKVLWPFFFIYLIKLI